MRPCPVISGAVLACCTLVLSTGCTAATRTAALLPRAIITTSTQPTPSTVRPSTVRPSTVRPSSVTPSTAARTPEKTPLRGRVIVLDPGHNGGNGAHPGEIARSVFVVNGWKACDTTGTQTDAGYPETAFTWDVANRLAAILRLAGARVVLTRDSDTGVGPCVTQRAEIGNRARADAAVSIHADGAAAAGYGFHVIEPARVGPNAAIVAPSARLAIAVRAAFRSGTGEPYSTYTGHGQALTTRGDLGGLNLSTVPKIFIECGNMRNADDARRLTSPAWRQRAAQALAVGLTSFLATRS